MRSSSTWNSWSFDLIDFEATAIRLECRPKWPLAVGRIRDSGGSAGQFLVFDGQFAATA